MTDDPPAWSAPFMGELGDAPHLRLPGRPSRRWAYGDGTGAGVRVAVVDSGIEAGHPRVGDVSAGIDVRPEVDGTIELIPGLHDDRYGHGTACAGIIRAVAPRVELTSVRVLGSSLRSSAAAFAAGLEWCIDERIDVVNLSLSTSQEQYLEMFWELVDRAAFRRVMLVSAMNNEQRRTIPSEFAGVFSVACAPGGDLEDVWCNPDAPAEWGAAGFDVEVAWVGGGTLVASGNSFAAAVISGHLARIVGAHPDITPWQARTVLASVARNAPG